MRGPGAPVEPAGVGGGGGGAAVRSARRGGRGGGRRTRSAVVRSARRWTCIRPFAQHILPGAGGVLAGDRRHLWEGGQAGGGRAAACVAKGTRGRSATANSPFLRAGGSEVAGRGPSELAPPSTSSRQPVQRGDLRQGCGKDRAHRMQGVCHGGPWPRPLRLFRLVGGPGPTGDGVGVCGPRAQPSAAQTSTPGNLHPPAAEHTTKCRPQLRARRAQGAHAACHDHWWARLPLAGWAAAGARTRNSLVQMRA